MLVNKKSDMTPYDMERRPAKQYPFLLPLIWGGSWLMTRQFGLKIDKSEVRGIKPPFLIISTHQGFSDYYIGPLAVFPRRAMYVSDMEGFAGFGNWLYRGIGCIPKRRYVSDIAVVKNMKYALKKGQSVFVFPESRHSNVGTTAYIPKNLGKLAKVMQVPVVVLSVKGSYLANPFWDEEHTRKVPMRAKMECVCDKDELNSISEEELQARIEEKLQYDEYRYQQENGILIKNKARIMGLHKALYKCRKCGDGIHMMSGENLCGCNACGTMWVLSEDGWLVESDLNSEDELVRVPGTENIHIPDWYEWIRSEEEADIADKIAKGRFSESYRVRVEALPNQYGFVDMGAGELLLNEKEFVLYFGGGRELHFPHKNRESVQTEYNYRGKGMCIVLSTKDCCYYLYSEDENFQVTRLQFLGEYLYRTSGEG